MNQYKYKLKKFLTPLIKNIKNPVIVEFGVRAGISTLQFLKFCTANKGFLYSFDPVDCSKISKNFRWKFFKSRDDNFQLLKKLLPKKVDVIYLDSVHEAGHVEKIFFYYFKFLKKGGYFIIDDISHLPYQKNKDRNNFYCEINNKETFSRILEIYNANEKLFDLNFIFVSSGLAIIQKKKNGTTKGEKENRKSRIINQKHC